MKKEGRRGFIMRAAAGRPEGIKRVDYLRIVMYNQNIKKVFGDRMGWIVKDVQKNSIAERCGIKAGDEILGINGEAVLDYIDYAFFMGEEELAIRILGENGEKTVKIQKEDCEDLGLAFEREIGGPERCRNKCIFCFVDQLPRGMRKTLYVKDDDWRHSFMMGNYVTMTNLSGEDIGRIIRRKTSPLYVSVHAADEKVRARMLGNPDAPTLMPLLRQLAENGIQMHTQVVVCPGVNDGEALQKTVRDLFGLYPGIASVAVVPVGLTAHRENLFPIDPVSRENAGDILERIREMQREFLHGAGTRFVFAADELYIRAKSPLPAFEEYEDFAQIENGVGLIAKFEDEVEQGIADTDALKYKTVSVATGEDFAPFMKKIAKKLHAIYNINVNVFAIQNGFFGRQVTVTGLLTGRDIIEQMKGRDLGERLFLSGSIFKEFEDVTLDDMTLKEISEVLGVPCGAAPSGGYEWIRALAKEQL